MFTVTDDAAAFIAESLIGPDAPDDAVARLSSQDDGITLTPGTVQPGDVTYEHEGRPVLAIDEDLAHELGDTVLQVGDHEGSKCLELRRGG